MKTKRIQLRVSEDWYPKMRQAALEAGYLEDDNKGTTNSVSSWLRGLIANQIGEPELMAYHQRKEQFARCAHGELENFREIFLRFVEPNAPDTSAIHRATYELGSFLQDVPKGPNWDDIRANEYVIFEWEGRRHVQEQIHELLLRAVMHSVNYLAFGDIRLGGGSPPREKAGNLLSILEDHERNRHQEGKGSFWINQVLFAGQELCKALQVDGEKRQSHARHCIDLIERARYALG